MKLKIYVEEFLEKQRKEEFLNDSSIENYRSKLVVFHEYLYVSEKINNNNIDIFLNGLKTEQIFATINFYIDSRGIKTEYSVRMYLSVLTEFLKYLFYDKKIITNDNLINSIEISRKMHDDSFSVKVDGYLKKLIQNKVLTYEVKEEPINDEEYVKLIAYCDQLLHVETINGLHMHEELKGKYTKYISALMLKFILAFGFKVNILCRLTINSVDISKNTFKYKGYSLYFPDNLSDQIKQYISIREKANKNNEDSLFLNYNGTVMAKKTVTAEINKRIKETINKASATKAGEYTVMKMFEENIPRMIIEEFTGMKSRILDYCQCRVYELSNIKKDKLLKSKMLNLNSNEYL